METENTVENKIDAAAETPAAKPETKPQPTAEHVAAWLEQNGWTRAVAGEEDFERAVRKVQKIAHKRGVGLLIVGACGCGKTALARALTKRSIHRGHFLEMAAPEHVGWLDEDKARVYSIDLLDGGTVVLDDLGAEMPENDYGHIREPAGEFIVRFHALGSGRLYVTTNLDAQALLDRYGARVASRLKEMCEPILLKGPDKRQFGGIMRNAR